MAKKETPEELFDHYAAQCSLFIAFRLFAGLYQFQPREVYIQAVADLLNEFENQAKLAVQKRCNEMQVAVRPGQENVALQRYRIEQAEAISRTVDFCKIRMIGMNVGLTEPAAAPQETLEQLITRICKEQIEASKKVVPNAEEKTR